jgi:hypothetical protein
MENIVTELKCMYCKKKYGAGYYCLHYNGGTPTVMHPYLRLNKIPLKN